MAKFGKENLIFDHIKFKNKILLELNYWSIFNGSLQTY